MRPDRDPAPYAAPVPASLRMSLAAGLKRAALIPAAGAVLALGSLGQSPAAPEAALREIQQLLQKGDLAAAGRRLARALEKYPADPVLYNFRGVLQAQRGDYRGAEASFRKAVELAPAYRGAYYNLGRLYQEHADEDARAVDKAISVYERLLELEPGSGEANYQLAVLLQSKGEARRALEHLDRLPPDAQGRAQVLAVRCAALLRLGDAAQAESCAQKLAGTPDLAEADVLLVLPAADETGRYGIAAALLERLAATGSPDRKLLRRLAAAYEKQGLLAKARSTYERAAVAGGKVSFDTLLDLARVAYKQKDFKGALGYLAHARDLKPEDPGVHFFFGMVCVELDLPVEAEKSLREAVKRNPENPFYNYALGAVLAGSRKWEEALPYFERYSRSRPKDPHGRLMLAVAHYHTGRLETARQEFSEVVDAAATAAGAHYHLGLIAIREGKLEEAVEHLREAVRRNPEYAEAYTELGYAYMRMKEFDKAGKALERAIELDPESRRANLVLLSYYRRTRDPRAAEQKARFQQLQKKLAERARMYLRTVVAKPYSEEQ